MFVLLAGAGASAAKGSQGEALGNDPAVLRNASRGMDEIVGYMRTRPDLFPLQAPPGPRVLEPAQREEVRQVWAGFLDYQLILDSLGAQRAKADFAVSLGAFLSRYRHALEFLALADNDPTLRLVLDEALPEIGLPAGSFSDFKLRYLNVLTAAEFSAQMARYRAAGADPRQPLAQAIEADAKYLVSAGQGRGLGMTARNVPAVLQGAGFKLFFPVQKGVSEWMGDTRVLYGNKFLIGPRQIERMAPHLRPGDVLLVRREWFLSNIGLPGYWPHAALYIGTPQERAAWFDTPEVKAWLQTQGVGDGSLDSLLRQRVPAAHALSLRPDEHGEPYRVIEAMSEGVVFTSLAHSAGGDSLAVLRPRLSRVDVAQALLQALAYQGRPYDFNFDFRTDDTLVCTELVYKAYGAAPGKGGIRFPLRPVVGRPVTTANDIARQFDQTYGQPDQQFDLVWFLDGQQRSGRAIEADLAGFRRSWQRPKWHIVTQGTPLATR